MAALRALPFSLALSTRSFLPVPFLPLYAISDRLPSTTSSAAFSIPSILAGLWESILRAVPKKKTSHMKKRHRFMAGKALKDVTEINSCPACGAAKRAHLLCPTCVQAIKKQWKTEKA